MKYLYFYDTANDMAGFPVDSLIDMRYGDSAAEIEMFFEGNQGTNSVVKVSLAITSGKIDETLKSLARVIQSHRGPVIRIADDVNSQYIMSEITGCDIDYAS